ncbi:hypothetical protein Tco_1252179 [Tanacetum coccineum]
MVGKALPLLSGSAWKEMHIDKAEPLSLTSVGTEGVVCLDSLTVTVSETLSLEVSCVSGFVCFMIPKLGLSFIT